MKYIFLLGGFAGFTLTAAASYFAGHAPDRVFLDAAVGCLCGALLFRWFWNIVVNGMREVVLQRHAANTAAAAAAATNAAARPSPKQK